MHGYWLCRETEVLSLRGVSFRDRHISFLLAIKPRTNGNLAVRSLLKAHPGLMVS
jgi:hypothetical protein